jgi:hypothetical protein
MFRIIAVLLTVLFFSGCKLAVLLVEGGEVQSIGSGTCMTSTTVPQTGTVCIHEVADTSYSETFTAVPDLGWDFVKWNTGGGFLCADSTNPTCVVSNVPLAGNAFAEAIVASDAMFYIMPIFNSAVVEYSPEVEGLSFTNDLITGVVLFVAPEWLENDDVSLEIEIWGINGGFHEHGFQVELVSGTDLIVIDQGEALVSLDWTTDAIPTHSPENYTACVQAMVDGQPFGPSNCFNVAR